MSTTTEPMQTAAKGLPTPTFPSEPHCPPTPPAVEPGLPSPHLPPSEVTAPTDAEMQEVADMARVIATMTPVKQPTAEAQLRASYGEKCPAKLELPSIANEASLAAALQEDVNGAPLAAEQWDDEPSASDDEDKKMSEEEEGEGDEDGESESFEDDDDEALARDEMKAEMEDGLMMSGSPIDMDDDDFLQMNSLHQKRKPAPSDAAKELARLKAESAALVAEMEKVAKYKEALAKLKATGETGEATAPLAASYGGKSPAPPKNKKAEPKEPEFKYTVRADTLIPNTANPAASAAMSVATLAEKWGERAREKYLTLYDESGVHLRNKAKAIKDWEKARMGQRIIFNASERAKINSFAEAWEVYSMLRLFAVSLSRARVEMTEVSMRHFVEFVFSGNAHHNHLIPALGMSTLFSNQIVGAFTADGPDEYSLLDSLGDTGVDIETKVTERLNAAPGTIACTTSDVTMKVTGYYEAGTDLYEQLKAELFTVVNDEKRVVSTKQDMITFKRHGDRNQDMLLENAGGYVVPPTQSSLRCYPAAPAPKKRKAAGDESIPPIKIQKTEAMLTKKWRTSEEPEEEIVD